MNDLAECSRCHKVLVNEEYDQHYCMPQIKKWHTWKPIKIAHLSISERDGKKFIDIIGIDGTKYDFEEIPEDKEHTKISYQPPKLNTGKKFDEHPDSEQIFMHTKKICLCEYHRQYCSEIAFI